MTREFSLNLPQAWNLSGASVDGYRWQGGCASFMIPADEAGEVGAKNWFTKHHFTTIQTAVS